MVCEGASCKTGGNSGEIPSKTVALKNYQIENKLKRIEETSVMVYDHKDNKVTLLHVPYKN